MIGDPVRGAPGQARTRGEDRPRYPAQHLHVAQGLSAWTAAQVIIVDHQRLLVDRAVPAPGIHRQHRRGIVVHEVPPDLVRAVGEPPRVRLGARGQQQRRRVHRARRQHHRRGRQPSPVRQPQGGDAVAVGFQRSDSRAGQQRDIRMPQRLRDAHGFRVHLGAGRVRKGVPWRLGTFQPAVEIHPQRQVRGVQPDPAQTRAQVRDLGLVGHRRVREGGRARRVGRIIPCPAHLEHRLGAGIPGFIVLVAHRPAGGGPAHVADRAEILGPVSDQHRAVELGIAADVVIVAGVEGPALAVQPAFLGAEPPVAEDRLRVAAMGRVGQPLAPLQDQDAPPRGGQRRRRCRPADPGAHDDDVGIHRVSPRSALPSGDRRRRPCPCSAGRGTAPPPAAANWRAAAPPRRVRRR